MESGSWRGTNRGKPWKLEPGGDQRKERQGNGRLEVNRQKSAMKRTAVEEDIEK